MTSQRSSGGGIGDLLRQLIHSDPGLRAMLRSMQTEEQVFDALSQLAAANGLSLSREDFAGLDVTALTDD